VSDVAPDPGILHFSFTVSDLDRSLRFYVEDLGFELVHRQLQEAPYTSRVVGYPEARLDVALLALPGELRARSDHHLELIEYRNPRGERGDADTYHPGAAHLALVVDDIHARHRELVARGVRFVSEPVAIEAGVNRGGFACYFRDPDEIALELLQRPNGAAPGAGEEGPR